MPVLIVSALCAIGATLQFYLMPRTLVFPEEWVLQFSTLVGISLFLSLLLFVYNSSARVVVIFLLLRFMALAIIGIPEGTRIGLMNLLLGAYILEIIYYVDIPFNKLFAGAVLLALFGLLWPISAWEGLQIPRPTFLEILPMVLSLTFLAVVADLHRQWTGKGIDQERQISNLEDTIAQLTTANLGFQRYADTIQEKSAVEERDRITRDIHDTVGYTLVNIMMMMEEASLMAKDWPELRRLLDQGRKQSQAGLDETRRALRLLRSADMPMVPTIHVIRRLTETFQSATGCKVSVDYGNIPFSLNSEVSQFVFSMIQEGMTNSLRHGKASQVRLMFWQTDSELIVNLHDNGKGSDAIREGIGFSGMRERIARLGGRFSAGNGLDGFTLTAHVPYPAKRTSV